MGDIIGHKDRKIWCQIWLPSHVLQDPLFDHSNKHQLHKSFINHNHYASGFRGLGAPLPLIETFPWDYYNTRQHQQNNWQIGYWMQAFLLVPPGRTTSGTGVFLPTTASHPPIKKPEIQENDSEKKSEIVETPMNTEVETPIDSLEKLLPEEWIY